MKKKILGISLALCLLMCLFVSCGYSGVTNGDSAPGSGSPTTIGSTALADRKVITVANYSINTVGFETATTALEAATAAVGGYVEESRVTPHTDDQNGRATYTLRIPAESTDSFGTTLEGIGTVDSRSVTSQDVTLQYTDVSSRIESLRAEEVRIRELYASATTVSELAMLESLLTDVSAELTSLQNQLAVIESQVDYATFYVTLTDTSVKVSDGFFVRFGRSFKTSFTSFAKVIGQIAIGLVYVLPYALIIAVVCGVVFLLVYLHKKHNHTK